jgi:methyl-accepting chemotaxis protein
MVAQISTSSNEQSAGINGMAKAIRTMDDMTQQNAALVEEAAAAAQSMSEQAQQLVEVVSVFIIDPGQAPARPRLAEARRQLTS